MRSSLLALGLAVASVTFPACGGGDDDDDDDVDAAAPAPFDPDTAPRVEIDRFSDAAATMYRRSENPAFPAAGAPIDLDAAPYLTRGLGPAGQSIQYYTLDVQTRRPPPMYVLYRAGAAEPLADQLPIVDLVPGDAGYGDYWQEVRVTVPADHVANTIADAAALLDAGFDVAPTDRLLHRPLVPDGSTAILRADGGDAGLFATWYREQVAFHFRFTEVELRLVPDGIFEGQVPISYIHVMFNINPGEEGGGPASGAMTEPDSDQSHNVAETIPGDATYSPLWLVYVHDNAAFDSVTDLASIKANPEIEIIDPLVSCPIVAVED
jgi:hypothetical protein